MLMYKLCFYVPDSHVESVKNALFEKGAGALGNYSHCSWQSLGEGQYMPLENSRPYLGRIGSTVQVPEWRVEVQVPADRIEIVIQTLKNHHPYEVPAYEVIKLEPY